MSDLISREEALKVCDKYNGQGYVWSCIRGDIEKLPSAQPTQSNAPNTLDAISRQDAVSRFSDLLMVELRGERLPTWDEVYNAIKELPSIQPRCNFPEKAQLSGEDTTSAYKENTKKLLARMKNMQIEIIPVEEPKVKGKWIGGELGECSICGHEGCASDIWTGCEKTYCPNCGHELEGIRI